jgi:HSP20 family molecular chaperone IbpA
MNSNDVKKSLGKSVVIGLVALALGVVIGAAAEKFEKRSPATITPAEHTAALKTGEQSATWDPFQEMRDLRAEMDQMFQRSIERFHMNPQMNLFKDEAGYSLSLDVRDLKDRYEVRAILPDAKASDAKVKLDGNRLSVDVANRQTEKQSSKNGQATTTELGRYEQVIQLADNVKSTGMKVERKNHELLITIPKA